MRTMIGLAMLSVGFAACDNNAISGRKADSLKQELDTSLGKIKDSVKAKGERTIDAVKEKWEELRVKRNDADSIR